MEKRVHLKILLTNAVKDICEHHVMFLLFASFNLIKLPALAKWCVCVYISVPEDERHK